MLLAMCFADCAYASSGASSLHSMTRSSRDGNAMRHSLSEDSANAKLSCRWMLRHRLIRRAGGCGEERQQPGDPLRDLGLGHVVAVVVEHQIQAVGMARVERLRRLEEAHRASDRHHIILAAMLEQQRPGGEPGDMLGAVMGARPAF